MKKMKQITSFALCFIMVAVFSVTPGAARADEAVKVIAVKDAATEVKGVQGQFTEDAVFETTVENATDTSEFTATISYKDKDAKDQKISSDTVKPTKKTETSTVVDQLKFTFTKEDINKLTASTTAYNVEVVYKNGETNTSTATPPVTTEVEKTAKIGTVSFVNQPTVKKGDYYNTISPNDVEITLVNDGLELTAVKNDTETLVATTDYTVSTDNKTVTIKKEYLAKQKDAPKLTFVFKNAESKTWTINFISHNPKKTVKLVGYNSAAVTTVTLNEGDKLPTWNKAKYKAAGRKGYEMTGWTYNGKTVTTVPESDSDTITLTASFKKLSVGKAGKLTLTGHAGTGCGFDATSKLYTKADGSRRGFRFRYSSYSSMKSSTYKTTGLAKNTYTKTGLSKGKKRYVQVRYYYYDSTNAKVYGAYSTAKSVKTY